jgi:hypothetical protein
MLRSVAIVLMIAGFIFGVSAAVALGVFGARDWGLGLVMCSFGSLIVSFIVGITSGPLELVSKPARPASRGDVYAAIDGERAYQDSLWPRTDRQDDTPTSKLTIGEYVLMLEDYATQARAVWRTEKKPEANTLHVVRKLAAIAVNCMEQHGAPRRAS